MSKSLSEWCKTDVQNMANNYEDFEIYHTQFFRNPSRSIIRNPNTFKACADGVIINVANVNNVDEPLVRIKGKNYSLKIALANDEKALDIVKNGALVIDTFMTYYDVHNNTVPADCFLEYYKLPPIGSYNNEQMLAMEENLFKNKFYIDDAEYMFSNERVLNICHSPKYGKFLILQMADSEVNCIQPFHIPMKNEPNLHFYLQSNKFGNIRKGSQCTLIIPNNKKYEYMPLLPVKTHTEAGIDDIVLVKEKIS